MIKPVSLSLHKYKIIFEHAIKPSHTTPPHTVILEQVYMRLYREIIVGAMIPISQSLYRSLSGEQ